MINVYVVGCGGVGGCILKNILADIASLSLDLIEKSGVNISTEFLMKAGQLCYPTCVDRITLIESDVFEDRNALRQGATAGDKLQRRFAALDADVLKRVIMPEIDIAGWHNYVNPENIGDIIPMVPKANAHNKTFPRLYVPESAEQARRMNAAAVFLCVDNPKSIYEVSDWMSRFDDCLVLHGGNEKTSGQVTVYERAGGAPLDPKICDLYQNIRPDNGKRPDELGCEVITPTHDQTERTNERVALEMRELFALWVRNGLWYTRGKHGRMRHNEILFSGPDFSMRSVYHSL